MDLKAAVKLIQDGIPSEGKQAWVDLGAGSGLFTNALSMLLPTGSSIIAIDKKPSKIAVAEGINLQIKTADLTTVDFGKVDGVLMANAFHYVKEQREFLSRLSKVTKRLVLVEYNTDRPNQWVPYPVSFSKFRSQHPSAELIGEAPSQYHKEGMYAALLLF